MENFEKRFERLEQDSHQMKIDLALFSGRATAFATKTDLEILRSEQTLFHVEMLQRFTGLEENVEHVASQFAGIENRQDRIDSKIFEINKVLVDVTNRFNSIDASFSVVIAKFDDTDSRFDGTDKRLDGLDCRLDGVDKRLDGIDYRLDGIDKRLDGMDRRFDKVDQRFDKVDERFDKLDARFESLNNRLIWTFMVPAILAVFAWFINTAVLNAA
ncbi:hemolysin XhlA family protein [Pantoea stewartii]|uniref:hemolysin XhlA family protein n=1 Tax=Pantoea stewartii TaxID=66269 RepID=UPI001CF7D471|nr:hemolysin XhlA family protein [Pantoea stewartii]